MADLVRGTGAFFGLLAASTWLCLAVLAVYHWDAIGVLVAMVMMWMMVVVAA